MVLLLNVIFLIGVYGDIRSGDYWSLALIIPAEIWMIYLIRYTRKSTCLQH
ncbi:hypothetical protein VPHD148_0150 [Vibrio phage D148]